MPWLYYKRTAGEVLTQSQRLKFRVSFGYENPKIGILNTLTYVLAKFTLEGQFLGFETMTNQLQLCQTSTEDITRLMRFGTTILNSCTFDVSNLISANVFDNPRNQNIFYEMYIQDFNGNLIDVPVNIRNFVDNNGNSPNADGAASSSFRLVRRFFIYDTKSGVEGSGSYKNGGISTVVRYPVSIMLTVSLDSTQEEMIYVPLLTIDYRERSKTYIATNSLASVSFTSEYYMNTTYYWKVT